MSFSLSKSGVRSALLAILLLSAFFRCWGLQWGLPRQDRFTTLYVDEYTPLWVLHQMNPRHGDFNPHYSHNPTFFYYQIGGALALASKAKFISLSSDKMSYLQHPEQYARLYLIARVLCVAYGIAATFLLFFLGKRITRSGEGGLLTSLFYAVIPASAIQCHVIDTSVPASFWIALSFLWLLKSIETPGKKWLFLGALAAGLSLSTKYTCAPIGLLVVYTAWIQERRIKPVLIALLIAGAGYVLGTPYILLDTVNMLSGMLAMSQAAAGMTLAPSWGCIFYPFIHYGYAVGAIMSFLALVGFALQMREGRPAVILSALFLIPFLALLGRSNLHITRYLNETLPFILPFAAYSIVKIVQRSTPFSRCVGIILTVACLSRAPYTLAMDRSLAKEIDPRDQASEWMIQHVPSGSQVGLEQEANFMMPAHVYMDYWKGVRYPAGAVPSPHYTYSLWDTDARQWKPKAPDYWVGTNFFFSEVSKNKTQREQFAENKHLMPLHYLPQATFKRDLTWGPFHYALPFLPGNDWIIFLPEVTLYKRQEA